MAEVDFFVSHAGRDRDWAEWVAWHLREAGRTVELDSDWPPGENFIEKMRSALDSAKWVMALFSPAYFESERYTTEEWTSALIKGEGGKHRLVPVQVKPCRVPSLLSTLRRVELFDLGEAEAKQELIAAVQGLARPDGKPAFPGTGRAGVLTGRGEVGPRLPGVLPPVWNVGPRNARFVGRDAVLVELRKRLLSGGSAMVQALHGIGGVGKTQVAIEYAYRFAGAYDVVWWVSAEETGPIGEQYAALAAKLDLAPPQADKAKVVEVLRTYLRGHGRWLLLLDNAESPDVLRDWLPGGPGHILITSRNPGWDELATQVEVDVLPRPKSVELIRVSRPVVTEADADRLADALGDLPLALVQAAGFLARTGMQVEGYLGLLKTQIEVLLDQSPPPSHRVSLAAVIRLSTDRLAEVDPLALALVRIGAFLAPEPIHTDLLIHPIAATDDSWPPKLQALADAVTDPVKALVSLGRLAGYGLTRVDSGLQLHRLTQAVLRDQLAPDGIAAYRSYAQALLVAADPGDERDPTCWPGWARILPHLLATDPATSSIPTLRDLACRALWYLYYRGDIKSAHDLVEHLHQQWGERLGADDRHTLRAAHTLVLVLTGVGPYRRAFQLGKDTFARSQQVLGDNDPDTLLAAHHFAICLHMMGAFEQARELNVDTLDRQRRVLGGRHFDVQRTAFSLGRDLRVLGEVEKARMVHEDCLAYARQVLGDDRPATIFVANELGLDLRALGDVEKAQKLHEETFARARRVLGKDHRFTMYIANGLASALHALGDLEGARELAQDTLDGARKVLGDDSHFTIDIANTLAAALQALGRGRDAQQVSEDTLDRARRVFGEDHRRTRKAAHNLAAAKRLLGEAEPPLQGDPDPVDES
ncbi:MAG: FxSxx-COOH system tetratricopeptide repeat protein [Pseudonocardiales bacterium]